MHKIFFVLIFVFICGSVFSESIPLIKYYSNDNYSHACLPSSPLCVYQNSIGIDSSYISDSINGIKILGLSDETNAHVEINNNLNYSNNNYLKEIFVKKDIFSSNTCEFTQAGEDCSFNKSCLFAVSNENNAHLSNCGVFDDEIKLCCFPIACTGSNCKPLPFDCGISFFEIQDKLVDSNVLVSFSCKESLDANLLFYTTKGDIMGGPFRVNCNLNKSNYNNFILEETQIIGVKLYTQNCQVEKFVNISKNMSNSFVIPDSNFFVVVLIYLMIVGIILFSRKVNK